MGFIKLGFVGSYKTDFLHYLSRVLVALNKKVIVIDSSKEQLLRTTLPIIDNDNHANILGIDFFTGIDNTDKLNFTSIDEYEIALIDYGTNMSVVNDFISCNLIFAVTDFQRHNVLKLKEMIDRKLFKDLNVVKLFRDSIGCKINKGYINHLLDMDKECNILAEYVFDLTEDDYKCRLVSQYDNVFKFTKLSKQYKTLFADILMEMFKLSKADIIKAIKVAEGAKFKCK